MMVGTKGNSGKYMKTEEHKRKIGLANAITNKGKHNSPKTEIKKFDYGKLKIKKVNGKNKPTSHLVWCKENHINRVPFSKERISVIHHIDGNQENNNIKNLQLMTKDFHAKLHIKLGRLK